MLGKVITNLDNSNNFDDENCIHIYSINMEEEKVKEKHTISLMQDSDDIYTGNIVFTTAISADLE